MAKVTLRVAQFFSPDSKPTAFSFDNKNEKLMEESHLRSFRIYFKPQLFCIHYVYKTPKISFLAQTRAHTLCSAVGGAIAS